MSLIPIKKVSILNLKGESVGEIDLPESIFSQKSNKILIKEVIKAQLNKRNGGKRTAHTKNRSEVSGSKKKRRPQKRSGNARMGARNPVHHRGGSVAFGPNGAEYNYSVNKKKKKKALSILLSEKLQNNNLIIVDKIVFDSPKTKSFLEVAQNLKLEKKTLFVDKVCDKNFYLSLRNVIGFHHLCTEGINPLDVLKSEKLILSVNALETLRRRYE